MRIIGLLSMGVVLAAGSSAAQAPAPQPVGTMGELMVSMVYPAANELLLAIHRGAPIDAVAWAAVQRSAIVLAESGNVLMAPGRALNQPEWTTSARMLVDVGAAAYNAARARDAKALFALEEPLNASCVACHRQYRPNVHPRP